MLLKSQQYSNDFKVRHVNAEANELFFSIILAPYTETITNTRKDYENWLCLVALVYYVGKRVCYNILHTKEELPRDGAQLYCKLQMHKSNIHFQIHKEILSPANGIIDETKFDLLTYITIIILLFGEKYKELLHRLTTRRNKIFHLKDVSICTRKFGQIWKGTCKMFNEFFESGFYKTLPYDLKTCNLFSAEMRKGISEFLIVLINSNFKSSLIFVASASAMFTELGKIGLI